MSSLDTGKQLVLEYGGGLGDMLYQMYERGSYNHLRDLAPGEHATVHLIVHNPSAPEVFQHHPKRHQMTVLHHGYWSPADDVQERAARGLPPAGSNWYLTPKESCVEYYPHPSDEPILEQLSEPYLVIAPAAGTPDRTIPDKQRAFIYEYLLAHTSYLLLVTGRTYDRDARYEPAVPAHPRIVNAVDKLSVPGACRAVQQAQGLVTAHSALNLVGWWEDRPQLLLYPPSVLAQHAPQGQYDQWLFGANRTTTVHTTFDEFELSHLVRFLEGL